MWFIFGVIAIIATFTNLYLYKIGKDYKLAMAAGLSFTALTVVADYGMVAHWVKKEDWAALADVVPSMNSAFTVLTLMSIILNVIPIFLEWKKK